MGAAFLITGWQLLVIASVATATQVRDVPSLKDVVQSAEMVFVGSVSDKSMTPPLSVKLNVERTVFGDPGIRSITMLWPSQFEVMKIGDSRLVFVFRIKSRDVTKHEMTTESTGARTLLIEQGRVSPIELRGERKQQNLEDFIKKITAIKGGRKGIPSPSTPRKP